MAIKRQITAEEARALIASRKAQAKEPRKKTAIEKQLEAEEQEHRRSTLARATGQQVVTEYKFHPDRKWRFDFYLPDCKLAIEVEGGVWTQGRHTRGKGYIADMEKYNTAQALGYTVLRFTPEQVLTPEAYATIRQAITTYQELIR